MTSGRYGPALRQLGRILGGRSVASLGSGQLLERFAASRDEAAFEALILEHGPMVLGTCRRILADPNDVDDAFQATFLVLARRASAIQDGDRLGPWLHGVARRVALRSRALSARRDAHQRTIEAEPSTVDPGTLEASETRATLDEELARLPDKYREPLVLCYLEGLTHDEAAARLRWPVGTVRSRLAGGRDRLRDRLTRRGLAPASAVPVLLARASIPPALVSATIRVATSAGTAPASIGTLAKGVLIAMTWNKLKLMGAVGLMAGLTVGGAGLAAQRGQSETKTEAKVAQPSKPNDDLAKLQGRWRLIGVETGFRQLADGNDGVEWIIEGKTLTQTPRGMDPEVGELILGWQGEEKTIDLIHAEKVGVGPSTSRGLYRLSGISLEICVGKVNTPRPATFGPTGPGAFPLAVLRFERFPTIVSNPNEAARINDLEQQLADLRATIRRLEERLTQQGPSKEANPAPLDQASQKVAVAKATDRPKPETSVTRLPNTNNYFVVIPKEQDRVTVLHSETGVRVTHRFPKALDSITPFLSSEMVALVLEDPAVRQLAIFNYQSGEWHTQDLKEPTTKARPVLRDFKAIYHLGRFIYIFNTRAKKWSVLELKKAPQLNVPLPGLNAAGDDKMIIPEDDFIHIYDDKTGEWTHIDTKDDK